MRCYIQFDKDFRLESLYSGGKAQNPTRPIKGGGGCEKSKSIYMVWFESKNLIKQLNN